MVRSANLAQQMISSLLMAAVLVACGGNTKSEPPPLPPPAQTDKPAPELRVEVVAAPDSNSVPGGRALPIVVRVYQLKDGGAFKGADYYRLTDKESATLGSDLIGREEITLAPGQRRSIAQPLSPQATHLGVIGGFRDIDRAAWRDLEVIKSGQDNTIQVQVGAAAITARQQR